jgi:hypothetical protein
MISKETAEKVRQDIIAGVNKSTIMKKYNISIDSFRSQRDGLIRSGQIESCRKILIRANIDEQLKKYSKTSVAELNGVTLRTLNNFLKSENKFTKINAQFENQNVTGITPKARLENKPLELKDEPLKIKRCEWCKHDRQPCLNCYSIALIGRPPMQEDFQYIEKKIAI